MPEVEWSEAPAEVIRMAENLITAYHPDLARANVGFVMRSKRGKSLGKFVLGKASKVPDKLKPYIDYDFLIWLSEEDWKNLELQTKRALIDHELCHCEMVGPKPKMRAHDIEEFQCIVERYGLWQPHLKLFGEAIRAVQETLPGIEKTGRVGTIEVKTFGAILPKADDQPKPEEQPKGEDAPAPVDHMAAADELLKDFLDQKDEDTEEDDSETD